MICSRLQGLDDGMTLTWSDGFVFIIDPVIYDVTQVIIEIFFFYCIFVFDLFVFTLPTCKKT